MKAARCWSVTLATRPARRVAINHPSLAVPVKPSSRQLRRTNTRPAGYGPKGEEVDAQEIDTLVKTIYPPSTGEAILTLLASRAGKVVSLEDLAIAAYGNTPTTWQYASSQEWRMAAKERVCDLRRAFIEHGLNVDIEAVRCQGYKLVQRKPRPRLTRADMHKRSQSMLKRYDALLAEQPSLTVRQAHSILASDMRYKPPYNTFKNWLYQRRVQGATP